MEGTRLCIYKGLERWNKFSSKPAHSTEKDYYFNVRYHLNISDHSCNDAILTSSSNFLSSS